MLVKFFNANAYSIEGTNSESKEKEIELHSILQTESGGKQQFIVEVPLKGETYFDNVQCGTTKEFYNSIILVLTAFKVAADNKGLETKFIKVLHDEKTIVRDKMAEFSIVIYDLDIDKYDIHLSVGYNKSLDQAFCDITVIRNMGEIAPAGRTGLEVYDDKILEDVESVIDDMTK